MELVCYIGVGHSPLHAYIICSIPHKNVGLQGLRQSFLLHYCQAIQGVP